MARFHWKKNVRVSGPVRGVYFAYCFPEPANFPPDPVKGKRFSKWQVSSENVPFKGQTHESEVF